MESNFKRDVYVTGGLPQWLNGKESACNAGDFDSWVKRSLGERNENLL